MKDQERTPLRVVLRNFLNHIENLESQNCPDKSYDAEFQDLKLFSENVKSLKDYSCQEGEKEINKKKNRYKDILPFDLSRVVLNEYAGIPGSDYINANFIKGASGSPAYIASQGPLPSTVNDFWRMVVQCEVQVIVMACNEEEAGKAKCEKYWVDEGEEKQFGMISVKLLKSSTVCSDFSVRTMRLKYNNSQSTIEERTVCQLHYVAWPDHGVPSVVQPLLDMVRLVRDTQASETLPVLVHCSAGCGRTGTICAIDYVWGLLRTGKLTNNFSLLSLIREMRKQRIAMVQTKEQYVLVHQAVRELFKEQLCMIDSHPYENVDTNGLLIINDEEEHVYDSIESLSKDIADEKQDFKKEKEIPPPLPKKKQQTSFPSKKEKDVENLSAQQRAIHRMPKAARLLRQNEIQSLRTAEIPPLFENQDDTPKRLTKPIPSKGILRVPQLDKIKNGPVGTVKRSKSLKVVGNDDKQKLMVCSEMPMESKRRASLESNLEESLYVPLTANLTSNSITKSIKKYEDLNSSDHRKPLVRSYTTLDMRSKLQIEGPVYNAERNIINKVKLSRSNTQVDFSKLIKNKTHFSNVSMSNSISGNDKPPENNSFNLMLGMEINKLKANSSVDGILYDTTAAPFSSLQDVKDLRKVKPKKISPYQSILQKEISKANQSARTLLVSPPQGLRTQKYPIPFPLGRSQNMPAPHQFNEQSNSYSIDLSSDKVMKKPHSRDLNGSAVSSLNSSFNESLYGLSPQKTPGSSFTPDHKINLNQGKPHRIGKFTSLETQLNKQFSDMATTDHSKWLMDSSRMKNQKLTPKHSKADKAEIHNTPKSALRPNFLGPTYKTKDTPQKRVELEGHFDNGMYGRCIKPNAPFSYGQITKRPLQKVNTGDSIGGTSKQLYDSHHFDCHYQGNSSPNSSLDQTNHRLSAELKPNHDSPRSNLQNWHKINEPNHSEETDWNYATKSHASFMSPSEPYRNQPMPGRGEDIPNTSHSTNHNYFQSAPGVDIDQVAASIPQKDNSKSFMKVALEAFSLRPKQNYKKEDAAAKTPKPEMFSRSKKKQQQYL